jgi:uncharacterized membrane protein
VCSWQCAVGNWQLAVGSWQLAVGNWQLAIGSVQLAIGNWQLAIGNWQLAVCSWQLAVCSWQCTVGSVQLAIGSWQLAVGNWQLANSRLENISESGKFRGSEERVQSNSIKIIFLMRIKRFCSVNFLRPKQKKKGESYGRSLKMIYKPLTQNQS